MVVCWDDEEQGVQRQAAKKIIGRINIGRTLGIITMLQYCCTLEDVGGRFCNVDHCLFEILDERIGTK